jgi:prepilin-type N-terminal cleavage/methylation domain-containing protein
MNFHDRGIERIVMDTCHVKGDVSGFTLIELMIVIVLSLVLTGAMYLSIQSGRQTSNDQYQIMSLQQELRAVMDMIELDIHDIGCDPMLTNRPTVDTVFGITEAGSNTLTFTYDLNANGVLDPATEKATYVYRNPCLYRRNYTSAGLVNEEYIILNHMLSSPFTFFTAENQTTTNVSDICEVRVHLDTSDAKGMYFRQLERRILMRNTRRH